MSTVVLLGDCIERMGELADASIDAVVTDPPYGISFMGKHWDRFDIDQRVGKRDVSKLGTRLTGDADTANRKETARTASAFANAAGEAGAYDFSVKGNRAFQQWVELWATECLRVLKPGGYLVSFGGTRTYHRLASGIEDAGFEMRDCVLDIVGAPGLAWVFGSGFPKSLDVSKAIDKRVGAEGSWRQEEHPGRSEARTQSMNDKNVRIGQTHHDSPDNPEGLRHVYEAASPEGQAWNGWGTALKPAFEPIVVARKPLPGTVAANVLEHGTGAINIDACRIGFRDDADERESKDKNRHGDFDSAPRNDGTAGIFGADLRTGSEIGNYDADGRWPANVVLDEEAAAILDEQSGITSSTGGANGGTLGTHVYGAFANETLGANAGGLGDTGGASRFFYCAKVSRAERNAGLDDFEKRPMLWSSGEQNPGSFQAEGTDRAARKNHPTVKPIDLMRWLCRLVTPPGGTILDPFLGSGSTGCAAALEGFDFVGVEREPDYLAIAEARIRFWAEHGDAGLAIIKARDTADRVRQEIADAGQLDLLGGAA